MADRPSLAEIRAANAQRRGAAPASTRPSLAEIREQLAERGVRYGSAPPPTSTSMERLGAAFIQPITRTTAGLADLVAGGQVGQPSAEGAPAIQHFQQRGQENPLRRAVADALIRREEHLREVAAEGGPIAGAVGLAGEAVTAAPAGAAGYLTGMGLRAARPALQQGARRWLTPVLTTAGAEGGFRAAATPGTARERARAGLTEAAGSAVGGAAPQAFGRALRGAEITPEARQMLDRGIPLTVGQATPESSFWDVVERRGEYVLGPAGFIRRRQREANQAWNRQLLQDTVSKAPGADPTAVTEAGYLGALQARDQIGRAYDQVFQRVRDPQSLTFLAGQAQQINNQLLQNAHTKLAPEAASAVTRYVNEQTSQLLKNVSPQSVQTFRKKIKDIAQAERVKGNIAQAEVYEGIRDLWDGSLEAASPGFRQDLGGVDQAFAENLRLIDAAKKSDARQRGFFTPAQLTASVGKMKRDLLDPELALANATLADKVARNRVFGQVVTGGGLGLASLGSPAGAAGALAALYGAGSTIYSRGGQRALLGRTALQQRLTPVARRYQDLIRGAGGVAGAAMVE